MSALIRVEVVSDELLAMAPTSYLGGAEWPAYRAAIAGSRYDGSRRANVASPSLALTCCQRLSAAGFRLAPTSEAQALIEREERVAAALVAATDERSTALEIELTERGGTLYPFQRAGARWLSSRRRALLADEMGLGKTLQVLVALPESAATVVVCPAVAKGVWRRETAKWRPDLRVTVLDGRGSFRWPRKGEIVVTNYDILSDEMAAPAMAVHLVADEAHALKSAKTKRGKAFRALSAATRAADGVVWLLTATPLLNRAPELWSVLQCADLAREAYGSWERFVSLMGGREGRYGLEWGYPDIGARACFARVALRRERANVLPELPVKTYQEYETTVDRATKSECRAAEKVIEGKSDEQILASGGLEFAEISRARAALARSKLSALLELVESYEEQSEPVVVFSAHRHCVDAMATREGWAVISGDTPPADRSAIEAQFQAGELRGLACTIKAGGIAITLTRASQAIFVDLEWTPALNSQAEDRICRIGQTRGCVITRLVADHPLDQRLTDILSRKRSVVESSVVESSVVESSVVESSVVESSVVESSVVESSVVESSVVESSVVKSSVVESSVVDSSVVVEVKRNPRRGPASEVEHWAARAICQLAALDPDCASKLNGVGFNRVDGEIGRAFAEKIRAERGLTEKQWTIATKIAMRYPGQVGRPEKLEA